MKIQIKNTEVELKNKMRSLLIYEQITNKPFNPTTVTDMILYFYSVILACEPSIDLTFSELMDIIDEDPSVYEQFNKWLLNESKKNSIFNDDSKKKKAKK